MEDSQGMQEQEHAGDATGDDRYGITLPAWALSDGAKVRELPIVHGRVSENGAQEPSIYVESLP